MQVQVSVFEATKDDATESSVVEQTWLLCHQFCTDVRLLDIMAQCGAIPSIGIAFPMDAVPWSQGTVCCFLPMPIQTGLPVHVHASFQVRLPVYHYTQLGTIVASTISMICVSGRLIGRVLIAIL